jgi:hypothetical protein
MYKYTYVQIYSVKYYKSFTKTLLAIILTKKKINLQIKRSVYVAIIFINSINRLELVMQSSCMLYDTRTKY